MRLCRRRVQCVARKWITGPIKHLRVPHCAVQLFVVVCCVFVFVQINSAIAYIVVLFVCRVGAFIGRRVGHSGRGLSYRPSGRCVSIVILATCRAAGEGVAASGRVQE